MQAFRQENHVKVTALSLKNSFYLQKIGTSDWVGYICSRFKATDKQISKELAEKICQIVGNHLSKTHRYLRNNPKALHLIKYPRCR